MWCPEFSNFFPPYNQLIVLQLIIFSPELSAVSLVIFQELTWDLIPYTF